MKRRTILFLSCLAMSCCSTVFAASAELGAAPLEVFEVRGREAGTAGFVSICRNARGETVRVVTSKEPSPGGGSRGDPSAMAGSAYDRIQLAVHYGRISLKEGVLLTAKLLFAPELLAGESEYAPRPGEPVLQPGEGLTGFYKDVHRVMGELTEDEKSWLRSLSPDLKAIIGH